MLTGPPTVAIVDDDESLRRSVTNLLASVGIGAASFESAEVFLASGSAATTTCLILDLRLPGMNGLELMAQLPKQLPVILLTAYDDREVRERALRAGARVYLTKPFNAHELVARVRAATAPD